MKSSFERKYGKFAIKNLTLYLIGAYLVGYLISWVIPQVYAYLLFNPYYILQGQIWRLFTWVLVPPEAISIFTIFMLLLYYNLGTNLERTWGTYRYNLYLFSGFLFTVVGSFVAYFIFATISHSSFYAGAFISTFVSTYYINMSIFLAFAVTYPNMELLIAFIMPVKMKWFGILYAAFIAYDVFKAFQIGMQFEGGIMYAIAKTVVIVMSLLNFLIFWVTGRFKVNYVRGAAKRKREYVKKVNEGYKRNTYANGAVHKCVICGRTELDNPDLIFRYCSKCSGGKEYCNEHLFTHEHK